MSYSVEKQRDGSAEIQYVVKFMGKTIAVTETEQETNDVIEQHKIAENKGPLVVRQFLSRAFVCEIEVAGSMTRFILPFRASDGVVTPSQAKSAIYEWFEKTEGPVGDDVITTADMLMPYAKQFYAAHMMFLSRNGVLEKITWFGYTPTGEVLLAEPHEAAAVDDETFVLPEYDIIG